MNVLLRNRRKIYYCELYLEDGIEKFREPQEVMINFEPTNSKSHIFAFGNYFTFQSSVAYWRIVRSLENWPEFAVFIRHFLPNALLSL